MQSILIPGLTALGLNTAAAPALERYGQRLLEQNQVMNLTAITEPEQVARLHMLDCAAVLGAAEFAEKTVLDVGTGAGFPGLVLKLCEPSIRLTLLDSLAKRVNWLEALAPELGAAEFHGKSVLDVGTGAGFPGLVLKLCEPDIELTLLDSLAKRVHWLETIAPALGAQGVRCVHGRAEELSLLPEWREQYDIVTSRAVADLRVLCELCLPFVKVGGMFLAMKAEDSNEEVNAANRAVSILGGRLLPAWRYIVPGTNVARKVIRIEKVQATPARYPRRFSKIRKTPL